MIRCDPDSPEIDPLEQRSCLRFGQPGAGDLKSLYAEH